MKFNLAIVILLTCTLLFSSSQNIQAEKNQEILTEKESLALFFNIMAQVTKYYYYKNNLTDSLYKVLDNLTAIKDKKGYLTKYDLYKIHNNILDGMSGFYTKEQLIENFSFFIDKSSDVKIKYIDDILHLKLVNLKDENLDEIAKELKKQPKKIIIDIRDNIDCNKEVSVKFANMFVDDEIILSYRYYNTDGEIESHIYKADKNSTIVKNAQIAILTNNKTSSSMEAVAHSLKYHENIVVIGQDTAGKSNLYAFTLLDNGDASVIKNGEFFYKDFSVIDRIGLNPNKFVYEDNPKLDKTLIEAVKYLGDKK